MSHDEYDDEQFADSGAVPPPGAPSKVGSVGGLRTFDRRAVAGVGVILLLVAASYLYVIHSVRQSMSGVAEAHAQAPLMSDSTTSLHLPAAPTSTPLVATPSPTFRPTVRPEPPAMIAEEEVPQSGGAAASAPQAQPKTPSPEEAFADEERQRVLEARRASTRIELDSDRVLAQQSASNERDLSQASEIPGSVAASAAQGIGMDRQPHQQFLAQQRGTVGYLQMQSRYELRRGTIINARWLTTLDSTLPGGVLKAMVTESVKDSLTHSVVVLPAGTILTGAGDSQTQEGEARYLCTFDELELPAPDSRTFFMGDNPGSGRQGENGVDVSVDTHAGRDFGHAALYSVLQAGVNLASRASTVVDLGSGSSQVFQQNQRSAPTFHAYVGQPLTVIVAQTLPLDRFQEGTP